jgi:hypothetical protein
MVVQTVTFSSSGGIQSFFDLDEIPPSPPKKNVNINNDNTKKDTRMLQWSLETKAENNA